MERFFFLACEVNERPFTDDEQDEFCELFERFATALQYMAIHARGRCSAFLFYLLYVA